MVSRLMGGGGKEKYLLFLLKNAQFLFLESYSGRPADYFFLLLFNWMCCVVIALLANIMVNSFLFILYSCYYKQKSKHDDCLFFRFLWILWF